MLLSLKPRQCDLEADSLGFRGKLAELEPSRLKYPESHHRLLLYLTQHHFFSLLFPTLTTLLNENSSRDHGMGYFELISSRELGYLIIANSCYAWHLILGCLLPRSILVVVRVALTCIS